MSDCAETLPQTRWVALCFVKTKV